jgi:DNA-binding Xre family transcriptional regulator
MYKHDYSIDNLALNFVEHSMEIEKIMEKNIKKFEENNPGEPLPANFLNRFNICTALSVMCNEILDLKDKLSIHIDFEHTNPKKG